MSRQSPSPSETSPKEELGVELVTRDPERKGYETAGAALQGLGQALSNAELAGWVTNEEAAKCFRQGAGALGVQLDDDNSALMDGGGVPKTPSPTVLQGIGGSKSAPSNAAA